MYKNDWRWKVSHFYMMYIFYDNNFQQNLIIFAAICLEGDQKEYNSPDNTDIEIVVDPRYEVSFFRVALLCLYTLFWVNVW